ncbi:MAG: radical SAM protein [Deltaproteobacteria bacterium]|nr:radical SAM protein [Deltaproteobacteria bacterium]
MNLIKRFFKSNDEPRHEPPLAGQSLPELADEPETTYSGTAIEPITYGLPKEIESVCPECMEIINATLYPEDGKVWIKKTCKDHGEFKDIAYGDVNLYHRCEEFWFGDGRGIEDPPIKKATVCPKQCGLCNMHTSHSGLPIIDLTNRCNMTCPVCFANANAAGYLYEPPFDDVMSMLQCLVNQKPVRANMVQFSGGEPTVRPDFLEIIRRASQMGFQYIQVNTNGIRMAEPEFAQAAKEAGVENLYLQFDGVTDDVYKKTRALPLMEYKIKAIENCRKNRIGVVLVATLVKGFNDHQVGDIVKFAVKNNDVISGIAFQPVSFVGRFSQSHRLERRYTLADLAFDIERQTGWMQAMRDWFPIGCTTALSKLASSLSGKPSFALTLHPHCSQGAYFYIGEDGSVKPVSEFLDMKPFMKELIQLSREVKPSGFDLVSKVKILYRLQKYFDEKKAPKGLTFKKFLQSLEGYQERSLRRTTVDPNLKKERFYSDFFIAGMHFMDAYNFNIERVKRCVIHYPDPKGHLYPFCAYNGAPVYRETVESKYKHSPEKLKEQIVAEGRPKELELIAKKMGI